MRTHPATRTTGAAAPRPWAVYGWLLCAALLVQLAFVVVPARADLPTCHTPGYACFDPTWLPEPCPAGSYCPGGGTQVLLCTEAPAGSYCPPGSSSPTGSLCPANSKCAGGIAAPVPCPDGTSSLAGYSRCRMLVTVQAAAGSAAFTEGGGVQVSLTPDVTAENLRVWDFVDLRVRITHNRRSDLVTYFDAMDTISSLANVHVSEAGEGGAFPDWGTGDGCTNPLVFSDRAEAAYASMGSSPTGTYRPHGGFSSGRGSLLTGWKFTVRDDILNGETSGTVSCVQARALVSRLCENTVAAGKYCPAVGSPTAAGTDCPAGSYCPGGTQDVEAVECNVEPGSYCPVGGSSADGETCSAGHFCLGGSEDKTACPPDTYRSTTGGVEETQCLPCAEGKRSLAGASRCSAVYTFQSMASGPFGLYPDSSRTVPLLLMPSGNLVGRTVVGIVDLRVRLDHEDRNQVMINLLPPTSAAGIQLKSFTLPINNGLADIGSGIGCTNPLIFSDAAPLPITTQGANPTGSYKPFDSFSALVGMPADDAEEGWKLEVSDVDPMEPSGTFHCAQMHVLAERACEGEVAAGRYCPESGSDTPEGDLCPVGSYCLGAMEDAVAVPCSDTVLAGSYCAEGTSIVDEAVECPPGFFCEGGSSVPVPCPEGTYRSSGGATQQSQCTPCEAEAGTYCTAGSVTSQSVPCPAGSSCAGGDASAVPCAAGTFARAGGVVCTACQSGLDSDIGSSRCGVLVVYEQQGAPATFSLEIASPSFPIGPIGDFEGVIGIDLTPSSEVPLIATSSVPYGAKVRSSLDLALRVSVEHRDQLSVVLQDAGEDEDYAAAVLDSTGGSYADFGSGNGCTIPLILSDAADIAISSMGLSPTGTFQPVQELRRIVGVSANPSFKLTLSGTGTATVSCARLRALVSRNCDGVVPAGSYCPLQGMPPPAECTFELHITVGCPVQESYATCPEGHYCLGADVDAAATPCPKGTYRDSTGGTSLSDCSPCTSAPGLYCPAGSTSDESVPCPGGFTCAGGSNAPQESPASDPGTESVGSGLGDIESDSGSDIPLAVPSSSTGPGVATESLEGDPVDGSGGSRVLDNSGGLSMSAKAGIAIGAALAAVFIAGGIWKVALMRRRSPYKVHPSDSESTPSHSHGSDAAAMDAAPDGISAPRAEEATAAAPQSPV